MSTIAHAVHETEIEVISRREENENENESEPYRHEKRRANRAKLFFIVYNMQIDDVLVAVVVMAAYTLPKLSTRFKPLALRQRE